MNFKIAVGSLNPVKVTAAKEVFRNYFENPYVFGVEVDTGLFKQPIGVKSTLKGAVLRAKIACKSGDIGVGLEAGLIEAPGTKTGYLDVHFCAISKDELTSIGSSSGFEYPKMARLWKKCRA